jgi:SOS-response transcriptional repressor LexA
MPSQVLGNMEFPLLGRIAAGQPVEAIPNAETFSFGDFTGGRGNLFVLRVKGDSMVDDHICNGDYILVEGAQTADNGEIVVALIEGTDATLKRFFRERPDGPHPGARSRRKDSGACGGCVAKVLKSSNLA